MKILVIVTESPWGSSLGVTALRFVEAVIDGGDTVPAIFFHEEGVYHAQAGSSNEAGTPDLTAEWYGISQRAPVRLLLCPASSSRRLPEDMLDRLHAMGFEEAGLVQLLELADQADRVVTL